VTAGVTNAIEAIVWSLGDPGDGILLGRPFYNAFVTDLGTRAESFVHSQPVLQPLTSTQTEDRYCIFRRYRPFQS
jgi:bifunctional pyridoxal-dependent enzyme with beta-cystathionase and maltose regulon repressor activities